MADAKHADPAEVELVRPTHQTVNSEREEDLRVDTKFEELAATLACGCPPDIAR